MTGIPDGTQQVMEANSFTYSLGLTNGVLPESDNVTVSLTVTPSDLCSVTPTTVLFVTNQEGQEHNVVVTTKGNFVDEGTSEIA